MDRTDKIKKDLPNCLLILFILFVLLKYSFIFQLRNFYILIFILPFGNRFQRLELHSISDRIAENADAGIYQN